VLRNHCGAGRFGKIVAAAARQLEAIMASNKPVERKGAEPAQPKDKTHKPARHIEETARLASSVEPDKNPEKVRKAKN
jgi:hypothetical protein